MPLRARQRDVHRRRRRAGDRRIRAWPGAAACLGDLDRNARAPQVRRALRRRRAGEDRRARQAQRHQAAPGRGAPVPAGGLHRRRRRRNARPFDTVYVSLYKYFNAASGAILAGPRALLDSMHHTRRMFGGGLSSVWPFAAIARHYAKGFGDRYKTAVQVSEELIRILPQRGAFAVERVPSGTNLFRLRAPAADPAAFQKRLAAQQIMLATASGRRVPDRRQRDAEPDRRVGPRRRAGARAARLSAAGPRAAPRRRGAPRTAHRIGTMGVHEDLRYAWRALAAAPGVAVAAILSLALGIGANIAIFSVASALLLRPLPYQDADRLVILWNRSPGLGIAEDWFSTAQYFDIKTAIRAFEQRRDRDRRQLQPDRRRRARAHRHHPRVVEPAADARRAAGARPPVHRRRGSRRRRRRRHPRPRHLAAPLRRRSGRRRPLADAQRPAVPDRRRAAGRLLAAARSAADARRRRAGRGAAAAAARPPTRRRSARARTTTSSAS